LSPGGVVEFIAILLLVLFPDARREDVYTANQGYRGELGYLSLSPVSLQREFFTDDGAANSRMVADQPISSPSYQSTIAIPLGSIIQRLGFSYLQANL